MQSRDDVETTDSTPPKKGLVRSLFGPFPTDFSVSPPRVRPAQKAPSSCLFMMGKHYFFLNKNLTESLKSDQNINIVTINFHESDKENLELIQSIMEAVNENKYISTLNIVGSNQESPLHNKAYVEIANNLATNFYLKTLKIALLPDAATAKIIMNLNQNISLLNLSLHCFLGPLTEKALLHFVQSKECNLHSLILDSNIFSKGFFIKLNDALKTNISLKHISLENVHLQEYDFNTLPYLLSRNLPEKTDRFNDKENAGETYAQAGIHPRRHKSGANTDTFYNTDGLDDKENTFKAKAQASLLLRRNKSRDNNNALYDLAKVESSEPPSDFNNTNRRCR